MNINNINIKNLILEKDHLNNPDISQRRILYSDSNYFYKIWNKDFYYFNNFKNAYQLNFYEDISLLKETIVDNNHNIIGYINYKGTEINYQSLNINKLNDLINRIYNNTLKTNIIYIDFTITNIVEYENKYYLVDLEPTCNINEINNIKNIKFIIENNLLQYRNRFKSLLGITESEKVKTYRYATYYNKDIKYGTANTRIFLEKDFLPKLKGSVLFIGVNYYNDFYHKLVKDEELFETIDILERSIEFGSPYVHYIGDILDFNVGKQYDNVVFFGILGHDSDWETIKNNNDIKLCFKKINSLVKPNGSLLLGPATMTHTEQYWDNIYNSEFKNYKKIFTKKIDINYIWYGIKT